MVVNINIMIAIMIYKSLFFGYHKLIILCFRIFNILHLKFSIACILRIVLFIQHTFSLVLQIILLSCSSLMLEEEDYKIIVHHVAKMLVRLPIEKIL